MNVFKKLKCSLLAGCLIFGMMGQTGFAAEKEQYSYTVTLSAGNQGSFTGTDAVQVKSEQAKVALNGGKITITDLKQGDQVALNVLKDGAVSMDQDSRYYVRGVRLSGRDNNDAKDTATAAFTVDSDADYVVAYGIKGEMVTYTINYQDQNGNAIADSVTYYGNVGDRPMVAYHYIEGYQPQAYNLTKTLSKNEAENVFTFVYEPVPEDTVTTETEVITRPDVTTGTAGGNAGQNAGTTTGGNTANGDTQGTTDNGATDNGTTDNQNQGTTEVPDEDVPQNVVDLDDEDVPLDNKDLDRPGSITNRIPIYATIAVAAVAALAAAGFVYVKRFKKK